MAFTIIVDGPNFINDLHRHGKDEDYIMNTLSFETLHVIIQKKLKEHGLFSHPFLHTEFICSNKEKLGRFEGKARERLLEKLRRETGVSVREISLSSVEGKEKGVDMTVFVRMLEMGKAYPPHHIVLIASDKDYVPAIKTLTTLGIHTVLVGFDDGKYPTELINEAYLFLDLNQILNEMENKIKSHTKEEGGESAVL